MKVDLSEVPTSDLLNEAFRRRAIQHMKFKQEFPLYRLQNDEEYFKISKYVVKDGLLSGASLMGDANVFNVSRSKNLEFDTIELSVDYFVCRHPVALKKEEDYG